MTPRIDTERLLLAPLRPEDAGAMARVLADPVLYQFMDGGPPTADELEATYRRWVQGPPRAGDAWHNWVIRLAVDGTAIGHLQATVTDDGAAADIAWVVGTAWQGRGYASEAARALVAWLEAQGVGTITAHVHPDHLASARVAANAGLAPTDEVAEGEVVWRHATTSNG